MKPLVSIISINYNESEVTYHFLDSVYEQDYKNIEIWVVDNGSKLSCVPKIHKNYLNVNTIESKTNLGFAGGNNLALDKANGDLVFFVNNDTILAKDTISKLVKSFEDKPNAGMISPKIYYYNYENQNLDKETTSEIIQYAGTSFVNKYTARNKTYGTGEIDKGQYSGLRPTAYVHGAAMMVRKEAIKKVGKMYEGFFLYYEELDWSARIRKAGYEIYINGDARIYHKESLAVNKISALKSYYLMRNRVLFMRRNSSFISLIFFSLFVGFILLPKELIKYISRGEMKNAKSILKALLWNVYDIVGVNNRNLDPIPSPSPSTLVSNIVTSN